MEENTINRDSYRDEKGRFKEGSPGRPPGSKNFTTKVKLALEKIAEGKDYTYEEALVKTVLHKAIVERDPVMIRLIWNYLDGMPTIRQEIKTDNKTPAEELREMLDESEQDIQIKRQPTQEISQY